MHILNMRPEADRGSGQSRTLARFDAQVTADVRMYHLALRRKADGSHAVYPPNLRGTMSATFAPAFARVMTAAALAAYIETQNGGQTAHGDDKAA